MQKPCAVIDASCVIALDAVSTLPLLAFVFSRALIQKAVRVELFRRRSTKDRIKSAIRSYGFVQACDDYDPAVADVFLAERIFAGKKDRGEAEAVAQATTQGAMAIIDDRWGRQLAVRNSLECHGTIWILERLYDLRLVTESDLRRNFLVLLHRGAHIPIRAVNELLRRIGQEPIQE
jgi:predicted nucleic acid-binding protein